ncbi:hypothetical protein RCO27_16625 [Sphingosinicella sp. LHD-64]|nr:hypothetical protein [Sphingosinicella sp. LHD-64]MDQ8757853.1 hypothetical protein [Sphingosinicella sp. LHD-64]
MRHLACPGSLLLALGACAHIPDHIRVEVDGNAVEIVKKPAIAPADEDE